MDLASLNNFFRLSMWSRSEREINARLKRALAAWNAPNAVQARADKCAKYEANTRAQAAVNRIEMTEIQKCINTIRNSDPRDLVDPKTPTGKCSPYGYSNYGPANYANGTLLPTLREDAIAELASRSSALEPEEEEYPCAWISTQDRPRRQNMTTSYKSASRKQSRVVRSR